MSAPRAPSGTGPPDDRTGATSPASGTPAGCPRVARARAGTPADLEAAMDFARACAAGAVLGNGKGRRLSADARDDVVQEALVRVLRGITQTEKPVQDLQDWVRGTVDLILRERWRRHETTRAGDEPEEARELRSREVGPAEALLDEERRALVRGCLDGLPAHYRTLLLLRYRDAHTNAEVAARVGRTEKAVERAVPRALALVRACLERKRMAP